MGPTTAESAAGYALGTHLFNWLKLPAAISADITPSAPGKKRGFCRLLLEIARSNFSGHHFVRQPAKKRGLCRLLVASMGSEGISDIIRGHFRQRAAGAAV
jgi:hypothetical protein